MSEAAMSEEAFADMPRRPGRPSRRQVTVFWLVWHPSFSDAARSLTPDGAWENARAARIAGVSGIAGMQASGWRCDRIEVELEEPTP